jgi:hypothetical protein
VNPDFEYCSQCRTVMAAQSAKCQHCGAKRGQGSADGYDPQRALAGDVEALLKMPTEWLSTCPRCGSDKINRRVDESASPLLVKEIQHPSNQDATACMGCLFAPLTLGLSIPIAGAVAMGTDATRAVTADGRRRKILAEQIRCSVLTCRICERRWTPTDWDAIHDREAERGR